MSRITKSRKFKLLAPMIAALLIATVILVTFYGFNGTPDAQVNEAQNDVQNNIGSYYPGMIDMVSASVEKNQSTLNATINLKEPVTALGENESAQFDTIVILENETDVLQTYELRIDINATGAFGIVQNVQTKNQQPLQLNSDGNKLTMTTPLGELSNATKAEWNVCSTYEKLSSNQVISNAYDFMPDEGLRTTNFGIQ